MAVVGSPFCEHKKLRTSCAICKAAAVPPPAPRDMPYVATYERDDAKPAREPKKALGGPGKPLMPKRTRQNARVTRAEAEAADAWWVRK